MNIEKVEAMLEEGTIEQIVQNMDKEQADLFLDTVYCKALEFRHKENSEEKSASHVNEWDPHFVQTVYTYAGYDLDKKMIYG